MMGKPAESTPPMFVLFDFERMIHQRHPLRLMDSVLDLSFVRAEVKHLYGDRGNESIDPEVIIRLLLVLVAENVRSERELMMLMPARLDWCWFCHLDPLEPAPHHSVLSKARKRWGLEIFESIFTRVLQQCVEVGLVGGETCHVDSTLLKAAASLDSRVPRELWEQLEAGLLEECGEGDHSPADPPPPPQDTQVSDLPPRSSGPVNRQRVSRTDPDAATVTRKGRGTLLAYRDHCLVDAKRGIVLATIATPGDTDDGIMLEPLLNKAAETLDKPPGTVVGDSMYGTRKNFEMLEEREIRAVLMKRRGKDSAKIPWTAYLDDSIHPAEAHRLMRQRKVVAEGRFGNAHTRYDHNQARWRRRWRMQIQCSLVGTVQNALKLARHTRLKPAMDAAAALTRAIVRSFVQAAMIYPHARDPHRHPFRARFHRQLHFPLPRVPCPG